MASQSAVIISPALETSFTNYPNPFEADREYTPIAYYLPEDRYVTIKIYTIIGDLIISLNPKGCIKKIGGMVEMA